MSHRLRFSLLSLVVLVAILACGFGALRSPTVLAASLTYTATVLVLAVAVMGALFRRGEARAFWAGFGILGWGYLYLSINLGFDQASQNPYSRVNSAPLVTDTLIDYVESVTDQPKVFVLGQPVRSLRFGTIEGGTIVAIDEGAGLCTVHSERAPFAMIPTNQIEPLGFPSDRFKAHTLLSLIFGYAGGLVAWAFARRTHESELRARNAAEESQT